jgi:hypothetical protein
MAFPVPGVTGLGDIPRGHAEGQIAPGTSPSWG